MKNLLLAFLFILSACSANNDATTLTPTSDFPCSAKDMRKGACGKKAE